MSAGITSVLSSAALDAEARGHFDGSGFSGIVGVGNNFEFIFLGQFHRVGIAGDDRNLRAICPVVQRGEHVMQHGLRQRGARWLIENGRQALFRGRQILDHAE